MEKVKGSIELFKELLEQQLEVIGFIRQEDIDMAYALSIEPAQTEALSVGNNEDKLQPCNCTGNMKKCMTLDANTTICKQQC